MTTRIGPDIEIEWPTILLLAGCYSAWIIGIVWLPLPGSVILVTLCLTLHSSLQHEVLHGHPFRSRFWSELTVFPALGLFIPYQRFRDTHLDHHRDALLTDPYEDPESNFMDPALWARLPQWVRSVVFNNTLAWRMILGPLIAQVRFMSADWRLARAGDRRIFKAWGLHAVGAAPVIWIVSQSSMPLWAYVLSAYLALSILRIRTYLEHRAHEKASARTVVVEDRGPLAFLFLNNNLHVVHHMHPRVAWYRLPALYRERRSHYLARNGGYRYRNYAEVFRRHLLRSKDPVPHPLMAGKRPMSEANTVPEGVVDSKLPTGAVMPE